jgi:hypothetical protein
MTKKNVIISTVTLLVVAGFYIYLYRDYFKKPYIQISHTFRPKPVGRRPAPAGSEDDDNNLLIFSIRGNISLTRVKVIPVNELLTNKFAHPIWSMVTESNSAPLRVFSYGGKIHGMHPEVKGAKAEALDPNVPYRLFIEAGNMKGEHDFMITEDSHLAQ